MIGGCGTAMAPTTDMVFPFFLYEMILTPLGRPYSALCNCSYSNSLLFFIHFQNTSSGRTGIVNYKKRFLLAGSKKRTYLQNTHSF
jgi:hypothetical protein